jgi:hypothetical protein
VTVFVVFLVLTAPKTIDRVRKRGFTESRA